MAAPANNLFLRLHKWASRQDENYCTEALALVLSHLLAGQPEVGVRLLSSLTEDFLVVPQDEAANVDIRTQVETTEGRPDLEITWTDFLVVIEAKVESELHKGQLEGYRVMLRESGRSHTRLVLLTRYPQTFDPPDEKPDLTIRWYQVAEWLDREIRHGAITDPVARFLSKQFVDFLEERNMAIAQVNWQMAEGVRALRSLLAMLAEAAAACHLSPKKAFGWDWLGFMLEQRYWVGVILDNPSQLCFQVRPPIDTDRAKTLGVGAVVEAPAGGLMWQHVVDLDSEQAHFYSRSKASQMQWLQEFLGECLAQASSIAAPGQPPIPEEPEGN
jgi:hypothetical protein